MRLVNWVASFGVVLALPAVAPAQAVKRADIVGTWVANVDYTGSRERATASKTTAPMAMKVRVRATFWADGLFMFDDDSVLEEGFGTHGSGRWKLTGDTLWWGTDFRYGLYGRAESDTTSLYDKPGEFRDFLVKDSLNFWTTPREKRKPHGKAVASYWRVTAYKVSLKDGRLVLHRLDELSNTDWNPREAVYERTRPKS